MSEKEYQQQVERIKSDERYPDSLKQWMLSELERIYLESNKVNSE